MCACSFPAAGRDLLVISVDQSLSVPSVENSGTPFLSLQDSDYLPREFHFSFTFPFLFPSVFGPGAWACLSERVESLEGPELTAEARHLVKEAQEERGMRRLVAISVKGRQQMEDRTMEWKEKEREKKSARKGKRLN